MTYPSDDRPSYDQGNIPSAGLPYAGYQPDEQYLDPYTGQPLNTLSSAGSYKDQTYANQTYGDRPYEVPGDPAQAYDPYTAQPYPQYPAQQQFPGQPYPGYPATAYGQPYPAVRGTNGMAIGALIAAIAGGTLCGVGAILGPILGHIALGQIKRTGEDGRGMALAGIIIGYVLCGLVVLWIVVLLIIGATSGSSSSY